MKCVTKLSHRSSGGGAKAGVDGEGEGEEWDADESGSAAANGGGGGAKRKRDDIEPILEAQSAQLAALQQTNADILEQLRALKEMLSQPTKTDTN